MQSFEKYHPIMSVHYTMDWLTTFKIKDIFQLRADRQVATESGREFDQKITTPYFMASWIAPATNSLAVSVSGISAKRKPWRKYALKRLPAIKAKAL